MILSFSSDDQYDVFLAYWGDSSKGSQTDAQNLYSLINCMEIGNKRHLKVYFHPETDPFGRFDDTPMIVARTPLFLLVANSNIPRNAQTGQLLSQRDDGTLRNLYEEVETFHSTMFKKLGGKNAAKVFISDSFSPKDAEALHVIFSGTIALQSVESTKRWIIDFFHGTYIECWYRRNKLLSEKEFEAGKWIKEAEELWQDFKPEVVGRSLLIFYLLNYSKDPSFSRDKVLRLRDELLSIGVRDQKTRDVMNSVSRMLSQ